MSQPGQFFNAEQHQPDTSVLPTVRIQLLNGFHLAINGRAIADTSWRLSKARSILQFLALSPGHHAHREQIMDAFWPDVEPRVAAANVYQVVHAARRAIGTVLEQPARPEDIIRLRRQIVSLEPPGGLWVDVAEFAARAAVARADDRTGIESALDLYAGDLLPEQPFDDWLAERREMLRSMRLDLLDRLGRLHVARVDHDAAALALRQLVALDPLREEAHVLLMEAYAHSGRRSQALQQFELLTTILSDELGVDPQLESQLRYGAIRDSNLSPSEPRRHFSTARPATAQLSTNMDSAEPVTALLGRDTELHALWRKLESAMKERGGVALVTGEAGIGKTRLIEQLSDMATAAGADALWGLSHGSEGTPAFWPWTQIVRAWIHRTREAAATSRTATRFDEIAWLAPELLGDDISASEGSGAYMGASRFRLFAGVGTFFANASTTRPLVLIFDDAHWADTPTLRLLEFVARQSSNAAMLIVVIWRSTDIDEDHPLTITIDVLRRLPGAIDLNLRGLLEPDVRALAERIADRPLHAAVVNAISEQTEGNPLFIHEIVRLLDDDDRTTLDDPARVRELATPSRVRGVISQRLRRLSPTCSAVLNVAAIVGSAFNVSVIERASGLTRMAVLDALDEAAGAHVVRPGGSGRRHFSHALIHRVIYDAIPLEERSILHQHVATILEERLVAGRSSNEFELAHHYFEAGSAEGTGRAVAYARLAGLQAMRQYAWEHAATSFTRALLALDESENGISGDDADRCELLLLLGDALNHAAVSNSESARQNFRRAAELARATGSSNLLARAALGFGGINLRMTYGGLEQLQLLEDAHHALGAEDSSLLVQVLARLATACAILPDGHQRAEELSAEAIAMARRMDDLPALCIALSMRHVALWAPQQLMERLACARELAAIAASIGDLQSAAWAYTFQGEDLAELGDGPGGRRMAEALAVVESHLRTPYFTWLLAITRATRAVNEGRYGDVEAQLDAASAVYPRALTQMLCLLMLARRDQDRLDELTAELEVIFTNASFRLAPVYRLWYLVASERLDEARPLFAALTKGIDAQPRDPGWLMRTVMLADACATLGDADVARVLYELLAPFVDRHALDNVTAAYFGSNARYLGRLAALLGRWDEAWSYFDTAVTRNEGMESHPLAAWTRLDWAVAFSRRGAPGDAERATALARRAMADGVALGMERLEREARVILRNE